MTFDSFLSDLLATVVGGVAIALLFFWAKEKLFPLPTITGRWYFQITTEQTTYKPYEGMILRYVALLWREGNRVEGTVEKVYENSSTGEREFVGQNRTRGTVSGYIEKNYLGPDKVYLHIVEDGHGRESTNFYELTSPRDGAMDGRFMSMVAGQSGFVQWQRTAF